MNNDTNAPGNDDQLDAVLELLSYKEIRIAEQKAGVRMTQIDDPSADLLSFMQALHWVLAKRENPQVTFDEIGDLPMSSIEDLVGRLTAGKGPSENASVSEPASTA